MIIVVDYGMGNLRSVQKGFEKVGASAKISRDPDEIRKADKLVLPGVGAFARCMENLNNLGLTAPILEFIATGGPFLGICLGLQLLFEESEEFGRAEGLKVIPGKVRAFRKDMGLKIPHMGWNAVRFKKQGPIFRGIPDSSYFYFVHSYYVDPEIPEHGVAESDYGISFVCAVSKENVVATQFHPEKSQSLGLKILENFSRI
jgi:glutamine amidotransferase